MVYAFILGMFTAIVAVMVADLVVHLINRYTNLLD